MMKRSVRLAEIRLAAIEQQVERTVDLCHAIKQVFWNPVDLRFVSDAADGLSGLVVDRYAQWLSVQITARATAARLDLLTRLLVEKLQPQGIFLRTEKGVAKAEGIDLRDGLHWGTAPDGPVFISENGLRYGVDLAEGQKTGFYLDQRENRRAAAGYLAGRRVLDLFCYSGGFALNAA